MISDNQRWSLTTRYLAALLAPALVASVMQITWPLFAPNPASLYLLAVMISAWYGGLFPGLLSVLLSCLLAAYFFMQPFFSLRSERPDDLHHLAVFILVGPLISVLGELLHRQRRRARINLESARRAEGQLAEAQRLVLLGSWNWEIGDSAHTWSDEAYRVCGLHPPESPPSYDTFIQLVHPDDRAVLNEALKRALKTQEPIDVYVRIIRPDGAERIIHSRGNAICDASGSPVRMHGTVQDVTERTQAEDELRKQKEILQTVVDYAPMMIRFTGADGRIRLVNRATWMCLRRCIQTRRIAKSF